ncbi:MAG TPA: hypothetical protein VFR62_02260, partial [Gemmatimonadales bacterium]|nr:hypothetical protein [Gemmatimonadales bacterium]
LDAAARILDGGRLYVDVVEINPPLIVGLNAVTVWVARVLGLSEILVYRVGFTSVLLLLLWLSVRLLRELLPADAALHRAVVLVLAFVLFPLAGSDYGEREHLVLALLLPYVLLATARSLGHGVTRGQGLALGAMAGFAFALKPHFLLLAPAVECLLRSTRRVAWRALLPETLAIAAVLTAYLILIATLTPDYFRLVGLLAGSYSRFLHDPFWRVLATAPGAVLALFALLAFVALRRHAHHATLWQTSALATAACVVAGAAQQKGLSYHLYPAVGFATLLLALVAADTLPSVQSRVRRVYRALAAAMLAAMVAVTAAGLVVGVAGRTGDPEQEQFEELVRLVRARDPNEGVFVMSYHLRSAYPLINYTGARSASRFPHLWILAAEYLDRLKSERPLWYREWDEMSASERYLNRAVLEDLQRRPKLLLVLRPARDLPVNGYRRLDYIAYFGRNPAISRILQEYQLVAGTGDYQLYERLMSGSRRTAPPPVVNPGTQDIHVIREAGAWLRFADPRMLIALLAFVAVFAAGLVRPWSGGQPQAVPQRFEGT